MKFRVKIGWQWYLTSVLCLFISIWALAIVIPLEFLFGIVFCSVVILFIIALPTIQTHFLAFYTLDDSTLHIRHVNPSGYSFKNMQIDYIDIKEIKETKSTLTVKDFCCSALSLDRIEIRDSKNNTIFISPRNKQEFIELLSQRIV